MNEDERIKNILSEDKNAISMLEAKGYSVIFPETKGFTKERTRQRMMRVLKANLIPILEADGYTVTKTGVPKR